MVYVFICIFFICDLDTFFVVLEVIKDILYVYSKFIYEFGINLVLFYRELKYLFFILFFMFINVNEY